MEDDFTSLDSLPTRKQKKKVSFAENLESKPIFSSNKNLQEKTKYTVFKNLQSNPELIKELTVLSIITFVINHQTFNTLVSHILPGIVRNFIVPENSNFVSSGIKAVLVAVCFYIARLIVT